MSDMSNENVTPPFSTAQDGTVTAPYLRHGETPGAVTEPLPVPGYPLSDVPPNATGTTQIQQVPNVHAELGANLEAQFQRDQEFQILREQNRALMARLDALEKPAVPPVPVALAGGGEPVAHHLHLADGRVIADHGGIGTHYSETLPDGSTKVTRIREYYPADEPDPVANFS